MENQPQVVLLGDSVLMDGVADGLAERNFSNVIRINTIAGNVRELILSLEPDLVVYEHSIPKTNPILSVLSEQPGTMLLAIDLNTSRVIVLNSQPHPTRSMQELCEIIKGEVDSKALKKEVH